MSIPDLKWAYGVTTVPSRMNDLLPRTLESLKKAGFDNPRLFVDGVRTPDGYEQYGLQVTCRYPIIKTFGNWFLSLLELYIREPNADRYAIFQDDFVTYPNLRTYLNACRYPEKGYWNLYTFPVNQKLSLKREDGTERTCWYRSNQLGKGAVALVFNLEAVLTLVSHRHMLERPQSVKGWKSVDGGIVTALKKEGWVEYVHNPSLVQHTGLLSSMRNGRHPLAESFRGEDYDALNLLQESDDVPKS